MSGRRLLLIALSALLLAGCTTYAAPAAQPRLITTSGEAEVLVTPDEVVLSLGVEATSDDLNVAKMVSDQQAAGVVAAARARGVEARHIQTEHISIEPRYRDGYEQRQFLGYYVRKTIVITVKDIAQFDAVLSDVLQSGARYVYGIQFRTTELRKHRDEARALAVKAAREKAAAMAGELGEKIGQPHTIVEQQSQWWSWYGAWSSMRGSTMAQNVVSDGDSASAQASGTLAPGQISVTASVSVSYELK